MIPMIAFKKFRCKLERGFTRRKNGREEGRKGRKKNICIKVENERSRGFGINYRRVGSLGNLITRMKGEEGRRKVYPMLEFRSKQSPRDDQGVPV